ncbi:hypothetical protein NPA31_005285 [Aurantimonas sp. MSK8Z-1]|uniref:hypothetical protein n=1 Tax=Mangrovibrevibacter kandeliae TaxID=2968473 RepID=UPI002117C3D6|nr:hypothetical protein [Aurantimonas sp. MSK8Z-1]MCW4114375.1 hypothetical protein [Aurantimonas sp. MSK8Z-1]
MSTLMTILQPVIEVLLSIGLMAGLPMLLTVLWRYLSKIGLDVDQKHRDALQTAIQNAALLAVSKAGGRMGASTMTGAALNAAVDYVKRFSPDAVKHIDLTADDIAEKIAPKAEAIATAAPVIAAATGVPVPGSLDAILRSMTASKTGGTP